MDDETGAEGLQPARIAVYDDMLAEPRILEIEPADISTYIENIASTTFNYAQKQGGQIPYHVIREVSENFIHADFKEPCVSIFDHGNTIRFSDQGPGIPDKERAKEVGFSSATQEMKKYIHGVGSGLPLAKEYLAFRNGKLTIEDNLRTGTVITIAVNTGAQTSDTVVYQEQPAQQQQQVQPTQAFANHMQQQMQNQTMNQQPYMPAYPAQQTQQGYYGMSQQVQPTMQPYPAYSPVLPELDDRDISILMLASSLGFIGPTELKNRLNIPIATAYRLLSSLEDRGLLKSDSKGKRALTDTGFQVLNS